MKTPIPKAKLWLAATVASMGIAAGALAATDAGETITNLATVSYEDALGNSYQVQSNEAIVTVAQIFSATLEADREVTAAPNTQVSFVHTLTNTGNGADFYTISGTDYGVSAHPDGSTNDSTAASNIAAIYFDTNGNNTADAGDTLVWDGSTSPNTVILNAGESATLIMQVDVPAAADGDVLYASLNAAGTSGTVDDLTGSNGLDAAEGTNDDTITVTTGPAFSIVKNGEVLSTGIDHSAIDASLASATVVEYTIEVTNTGGATATNVDIFDAIPAGTFLVMGSVSALGLGNTGDTVNATVQSLDETALATDLNDDGDTADTAVDSVLATDGSMTVGTTVRVTFQVAYDPTNTDFDTTVDGFHGDSDGSIDGDDTIENTAFADVGGDGNDPTPSNPVIIPLDSVISYGVELDDTDGVDTGAGDEDAADDSVQTVNSAYPGQTVRFDNILTNTGSQTDTFQIAVDTLALTNTFPAGTIFRFYTSSGVELTDGITPQVNPGESVTIQVRVTLPADMGAGGPYTIDTYAASVNDPAANFGDDGIPNSSDANEDMTGAVSSLVTESLLATLDGRADIANGAAITATNGADDADAADTDVGDTGAGGTAAITTTAADINTDVTFPLVIANESGTADSFAITGGTVTAEHDPLATYAAGMPTGWSVMFIDKGIVDSAGGSLQVATDAPINGTALLPPGAAQMVEAVVTVAPDASAGVQDIYFHIESSVTGLSDIKRDAVDVQVSCSLDLSASPESSINQGGTADQLHAFTNHSNETKTFEIAIDDSSLPAGWTTTLLVDTTADDVNNPAVIASGATDITVWDGAGSPDELLTTFTSATSQIDLAPGETIYFNVKFFAPSDAAVDSTASVDISVTDVNDAGCIDTVTDTARVVPPMDLDKTAAADPGCSCDSADPSVSSFMEVQSTEVGPSECIIWRLVAHNESVEDALNVEIKDARTDFTDFEFPTAPGLGTPRYCAGQDCTPVDSEALAAGAGLSTISGADITWDVGTLVAGGYATAEFCVKVQ